MKIALCCTLTFLVVLLHQAQATDLFNCLEPFCISPGILDSNSCTCNLNKNSECPAGYTPAQQQNGLCVCERKVYPTCPRGHIFDSKTCTCDLETKPKCSSGGTLLPYNSVCITTEEPTCPQGTKQSDGCTCVRTQRRECPQGKISPDGCTCEAVETAKPVCRNGCTLNSANGQCTCEALPVLCYGSSGQCEGFSFTVPSVKDCCINVLQERSYEDLTGPGVCRSCLANQFNN